MSDALRIALVGNPNCGKTSLFNHLTGTRRKSRQLCWCNGRA